MHLHITEQGRYPVIDYTTKKVKNRIQYFKHVMEEQMDKHTEMDKHTCAERC